MTRATSRLADALAASAVPAPGTIDRERLEAALVAAATEQRPLTYRILLAHLGLRHGSGNVARLCRALGEIDRSGAASGRPELACLVVRQSDGLPGEGYWLNDPEADTATRAVLIRERQARAFAWADKLASLSADP